eukprot:TRINITY_DN2327_c0_g1_i1.p1 TRINITY_DN2327_c0_g1~~TRINITY_DN2327_c0_g1_i1.p1  ORF type:complete len:156 (-),score=21.56 TRINITY_DN2327_c0_g1_i1:41-460(-)
MYKISLISRSTPRLLAKDRLVNAKRFYSYTNIPVFEDGKRIFTRNEVGLHNTETDGWVIVDDKVYNITTWISYHPGGRRVLVELLGKDATVEFKTQPHSHNARDQLELLHIGYVAGKRRYVVYTPSPFPRVFGELGGWH